MVIKVTNENMKKARNDFPLLSVCLLCRMAMMIRPPMTNIKLVSLYASTRFCTCTNETDGVCVCVCVCVCDAQMKQIMCVYVCVCVCMCVCVQYVVTQKKHMNDDRSHSCQEQRTKLETGLVGTYVVHATHHTLHRQSKPCTDDTPRYTHLNIALLKPM